MNLFSGRTELKVGNKKKLLVTGCIFLIILLFLAFLLIQSWRKTPCGVFDPGVAIYLKILQWADGNPLKKGESIEDVRRASKLNVYFKKTPPEIRNINDIVIASPEGDIPLRIYKPESDTSLPVVMYYHGGGSLFLNQSLRKVVFSRMVPHEESLLFKVPAHTLPEKVKIGIVVFQFLCDTAGPVILLLTG